MENKRAAETSYRVHVVEEINRRRRDIVYCEIGNGKNLNFITEGLESYCLAVWEPMIFDALLLAAAVEFCDRSLRRTSERWARDIVLRLPVHDAAHWNTTSVANALTDTLNFLTGDLWSLEFQPRRRAVPAPNQGRLPLSANVSAVIPFSDGLDSWSAATLAEHDLGEDLIRVRLGRKSGDPLQPFASIPYQVRAAENRTIESSGRSRGFKFTLISGVAAYLAKVTDVVMSESGQGALGPSLVPVGPAYADYRNHPSFTARMERFLAALLGHQIRYQFPRIWYTKGETLRAAVSLAGNPDGWRKTRSCWRDQRQASVNHKLRQCGICAACMLRRLSVHAAGLVEEAEGYIWEDRGAPTFAAGAASSFSKPTKSFREYAIAGSLHMSHLATLRKSPISQLGMKRNSFQIAQSIGESPAVTEARLRRLLDKHEEEWRNFVNSLGPKSFVRPWAGMAA